MSSRKFNKHERNFKNSDASTRASADSFTNVRATVKIDHQIGKTDAPMPIEEKKQHTDQSGFQPYQPKHRKRGTGCVYQINDHLWEGKYSPVGADGKRISWNVYAKTREECEEKLVVMIEEMKREIAVEKEKGKATGK